MKRAATAAIYLLALAVLFLYLPRWYDMLMFERMEKTHLFFSPVSKKFIYTERTAGHDPLAAAKAEDHHSQVLYRDETGAYYDRLEFERLLPFIYYRNMELRGYLPLVIDGVALDAETIRAERQVLELYAREINSEALAENVWPLFESRPGQAGLVFPDDRTRMTATAMEFVNADTNRVDEDLTRRFTGALLDKGFTFPARHAAGNFTPLKAYEGGVFLVDARHALFHVLRVEGEPKVTRVPLDPGVRPRFLKVAESASRRFHGLLLDESDRLYLVSQDAYALIPLPMEDYAPERMDMKILFDPLYRTVVYSDEATIRAVAMDTAFAVVSRFQYRMSMAEYTWKHELRDVLFPLRLLLRSSGTSMVDIHLKPAALSPWLLLPGALLAFFWVLRQKRRRQPARWNRAALILATGISGFIAVLCIEE